MHPIAHIHTYLKRQKKKASFIHLSVSSHTCQAVHTLGKTGKERKKSRKASTTPDWTLYRETRKEKGLSLE